VYFLEDRFIELVPLFLLVYWSVGARLRNWVLLAGNIAWLALFSLPTLAALGGLAVVLVHPAARVTRSLVDRGRTTAARRTAWIAVALLLVIASALRLRGLIGRELGLSIPDDVLPWLQWLGFSYFLLKGIHVLLGTARGTVGPAGPIDVLQYMLFLPTLSSGPLYRLDEFVAQLHAPKRVDWDLLHDGIFRAVRGMAKKVIAVPFLKHFFYAFQARGTVGLPAVYVVTYVILYTDFSGYCDIGIAVGRLLGFTVPENFKSPFTATTLTQFWRNWHATLGDWLRENVFIPLGGLRATGARQAITVMASMLVIGVWHGFSPVFIGWGAYHGAMMLLENWLDVKPLRAHRTPRWRLWARYALVQAVIIGGMFAFL
jgi:alginate O-acetyltransferase complex protein AlgI